MNAFGSSATRHFVAATASDPQEFATELVSVVVPAYNAANTINRTLLSVRSQTHKNLEILVVDDCSTDDTRQIVKQHACRDTRVRLISLATNSGVAATRNTGIQQARGQFVAPIDADDLWRTDKIALQLRAFHDGGERLGLVYTWSATIDGDDQIILARPTPEVEGDLLEAIAVRNIIGNGSSVMFRKDVAQTVGGYDPSLHAQNAQGCEDYKFYFETAEQYDFAVVPDYLTGYRQLRESMSSDAMQMLRSRDLCLRQFQARHPELKAHFHQSRNILMRFKLHRALREKRPGQALALLNVMLRHDFLFAVGSLGAAPLKAGEFLSRKLQHMVYGREVRTYWRNEPPRSCKTTAISGEPRRTEYGDPACEAAETPSISPSQPPW